MKKALFLLIFILLSFKGQSQFIQASNTQGEYFRYWLATNEYIDYIYGKEYMRLMYDQVIYESLTQPKDSGNNVSRIVYPRIDGTLRSTTIANLVHASSSNTGVLTSNDFNTFNNKQDPIILTTVGTGLPTFLNGTLNIPQFVEVDGSTTNEIELPSQVGQNGKVLTTNGSTVSWTPAGGAGTVTSVGLTSTDFTISGSPITVSGNITANLTNTGVVAGTYNTVTVDAKGRVTAGNASSSSAVTRSFNTNFKISSTQSTRVSYSFTHTIALSLLLTSGSTTVFLEISPDNGSGAPTGVWTTISQAGYSDGVAVAVNLSKTVTNNVQGEIPRNSWVRIRTVGTGAGLTSSVPNVVYNCGQETIY